MKKGTRLFTCALIIAILLCGCKSDTLSLSSFGDVTEEHDMRIVELNVADTRVEKWSSARSDDNSSVIQYVECNSEGDAASFYSDQVTWISDTYETDTETGGSTGNSYSLTASGYYYYVAYLRNIVIVGTSTSSNRSSMMEIISELPEIGE